MNGDSKRIHITGESFSLWLEQGSCNYLLEATAIFSWKHNRDKRSNIYLLNWRGSGRDQGETGKNYEKASVKMPNPGWGSNWYVSLQAPIIRYAPSSPDLWSATGVPQHNGVPLHGMRFAVNFC
jgi:hypothetical protein